MGFDWTSCVRVEQYARMSQLFWHHSPFWSWPRPLHRVHRKEVAEHDWLSNLNWSDALRHRIYHEYAACTQRPAPHGQRSTGVSGLWLANCPNRNCCKLQARCKMTHSTKWIDQNIQKIQHLPFHCGFANAPDVVWLPIGKVVDRFWRFNGGSSGPLKKIDIVRFFNNTYFAQTNIGWILVAMHYIYCT